MIKAQIASVCEGFKKTNLNKIKDKDFKNKTITTHLQLLKLKRAYEQAVEDLRTVHITPVQENLEKVQALAREYEGEADAQKRIEIRAKINAFKDVDDAQIAFSKAMEKLGKEEVKIELIPLDKFIEEVYKEQDYDATVVDQLFPVFTYDAPASPKKPAKK